MRFTVPRSLSLLLAASTLIARPVLAQKDEPSDSAESLPQPTHQHHPRRSGSSLREVSEPSERRGAWLGLGVGAGSEAYRYSGGNYAYGPELTKPTFNLKVGGTVGNNLRLGGELFGWLNEEGGVLESVTALNLIGQIYPFSTAGFFVKGGAGLARYGQDFAGGPSTGDLGWSTVLGTGYEIRVGRKLWLVPTVDLNYAYFSGRTFPSYRERIVSFGLGILFQDK